MAFFGANCYSKAGTFSVICVQWGAVGPICVSLGAFSSQLIHCRSLFPSNDSVLGALEANFYSLGGGAFGQFVIIELSFAKLAPSRSMVIRLKSTSS